MRRKAWRAISLMVASSALMLSAGTLPPVVSDIRAADPVPTVRIGYPTEETKDVNPFTGYSYEIYSLMFDQLVGYDAQSGLPAGGVGLADSWTTSADGKTWTFKLRSDLKWSDGQPLTSADVAFTFNYLMKSVGDKNELASGWDNTGTIGPLDSITAPDDTTVVMTLKKASNWPLNTNTWIVPEHIWKDVSYAQAVGQSFQPPAVGSGPFIPDQYQPSQYLSFARNQNYRGPGPSVDRILYVIYKNPDAEQQALIKGDIDIMEGVEPTGVAALASHPEITIQPGVVAQYTFLAFNTYAGADRQSSTSALSDPAFRDALGYAIDKQALVDKVMLGHAVVADSPFSPLQPDTFNAVQEALSGSLRTFDVAKANQLLDAAGYKMGPNGLRLDKDGKELKLTAVINNGSPEWSRAALYVTDWFKQVGIQVTPSSLEWGGWFNIVQTPTSKGGGKWDLSIFTYGPLNYSYSTCAPFQSGRIGSGNMPEWKSTDFDTACSGLWTTTDTQAQLADVVTMARLINDQVPFIPLYFRQKVVAYRNDHVTGLVPQPSPNGGSLYAYYPAKTWQSLALVTPGASSSAAPGSESPSGSPSDSAAPSGSASSPAASPDTSGSGSGSGPSGTVLALGLAVVIVLVVAGWVLMRRRRAAA